MARPRFAMRAYYTSVGGELVAVQTEKLLLEFTARHVHARLVCGVGPEHVEWWTESTAIPPVRDGARVLEPMRWEDVRPPDTDVRDPDEDVRIPDNHALLIGSD